MELTKNGKALIMTLLFRLLFGGYIVGVDQYHFNDFESAVTVVVIYALVGIFGAMFLFGKRYGLVGMIALETVFIILNSIFMVVSLGQIADAGMHNPIDNWWTTILRYLFSLLTLVFAIKTYKEK